MLIPWRLGMALNGMRSMSIGWASAFLECLGLQPTSRQSAKLTSNVPRRACLRLPLYRRQHRLSSDFFGRGAFDITNSAFFHSRSRRQMAVVKGYFFSL